LTSLRIVKILKKSEIQSDVQNVKIRTTLTRLKTPVFPELKSIIAQPIQ